MALIENLSICDFSSESRKYKADSLLNKDETSWKCDYWQDNCWIIVDLIEQHVLERLSITNAYSAFIEVFVSDKADSDYKVLVPVFCSMSPNDSKEKSNCKEKYTFKSRHFSPSAANKSWRYIKFVCSQPFNKSIRYGLSFIRLCGHRKTNTLTRQFSFFGKFKLKKAPSNFNKDAFSSHDLKYKKDLIGRKDEEKPKLRRLEQQCEAKSTEAEKETQKQKEKKNKEREEQKEKSASGKGPRKDKKDRTEAEEKEKEEDGGSSERKRAKKMEKPIKETTASGGSAGAAGTETGRSSSSSQGSQTVPRAAATATAVRQQPSTSAAAAEPTKGKKSVSGSSSGTRPAKPFERQMEDVVFVLSGFVNPFRAELREKASTMGAKYEPNWNSNCTHLICAVANTPKYREVKRLNGRIVSQDFIVESYANRRLCEWRNFMIGTYEGPDTDEEEEDGEERTEKEPYTAAQRNDRAETKQRPEASVAANDKRSGTTTNGYDSDEIYDLDTESEDDD